MRNSNINFLLKETTIIASFSVIVIALAAKLGYITNYSYIRNGVLRQSFGMHFPLILSAYIFYICSLITVKYGTKYPIRLSMGLMIVSFIVDKATNARNDCLCILLLVLAIFVQNLNKSFLKKSCKISLGVLVVVSVFVPFITYIFPYGSEIYFLLNRLTTNRLYYQSVLCAYYKPRLLGQSIPQVGLGGNTSSNVFNYFYVDSSLTRLLFFGGIIFFILFLLIMVKGVNELAETKLFLFSMVMMIVLINCFVEDSMVDPTTNLFLSFLMISYEEKRRFSKQVNVNTN